MTGRAAAIESLLARGFALLRSGQVALAERCGRDALRQAPGTPAALNLLGIALHAQARHGEAAELFQQLVALQPDASEHWSNLGTSRRAQGRLPEALAAYDRAAALGARSADFFYNLGLLHVDRGDYEAARQCLRKAHEAQPDDAEVACHYAAACVETFDLHEGRVALTHWRTLQGLTPALVAKIGNTLLGLGDTEEAETALAMALADPALDPAATLQLVLACERINRLDSARELLQRLDGCTDPDLQPDLVLAQSRVAQREARHDVAIAGFRRLADAAPAFERRHFHLYPLAKSLDAMQRYDDAFATLLEAHASQVRWIEQTQPDIPARRSDTMRVTRFGCDPNDVVAWDHTGAPPGSTSPVFVVAFPRSGTTLLEQTLDAHPRLRSMDEQPYLQNAITKLLGPGVRYPDQMAALDREQLDTARSHYWELVSRSIELQPGEQLLDKNPLNVLRLPAIARLFPHARIVLAIRHPLDVILSCFMQHFRSEFAWQCRELPTLALAYRRALDFWYGQAALLRPDSLEVRYETFVSDFEPQARRLAEFLELDWTDAMLAPGEHARARGFISTPSYSQVVQPVHRRSVGRWRHYERHLAPVAGEVVAHLKRWDYAVPGTKSR